MITQGPKEAHDVHNLSVVGHWWLPSLDWLTSLGIISGTEKDALRTTCRCSQQPNVLRSESNVKDGCSKRQTASCQVLNVSTCRPVRISMLHPSGFCLKKHSVVLVECNI